MSDLAVHVRGLGKRYHIGKAQRRDDTLRDALGAGLRRLPEWLRKGNPPSISTDEDTIWALKDVSFEVARGEAVGIIGRNGAGKSTLLKILSRITEPTEGRATIHGRVGSLLEVGTGFHPELTGRENIYLNGAILGMRQAEISSKFDEIVAFSEIEKFLDTPVKRYSSGMYVRLAFAVAAHLEPEVLLVDEVLAVGDISFQRKCLGKMDDVAQEGRTVLFVSHSMGAIGSLTHKCIYFRDGTVCVHGTTSHVVQQYLNDVAGYSGEDGERPAINSFHRDTGNESPVRIVGIWVNESIRDIPVIEIGQDFTLFAELETEVEIRGAHMGLEIKRRDGTRVVLMLSVDHGYRLSLPPGTHIISCEIRNLPLAPGDYLVDVGINQSESTYAWDVVLEYPLLKVADRAGAVLNWNQRPWGAVHWRDVTWNTLI